MECIGGDPGIYLVLSLSIDYHPIPALPPSPPDSLAWIGSVHGHRHRGGSTGY